MAVGRVSGVRLPEYMRHSTQVVEKRLHDHDVDGRAAEDYQGDRIERRRVASAGQCTSDFGRKAAAERLLSDFFGRATALICWCSSRKTPDYQLPATRVSYRRG